MADEPDMERPDYIVNIDGAACAVPQSSESNESTAATRSRRDRPWIAINFQCCKTYARIYVTADRSAFAGFCPRCAQAVRVGISPDGSDTRFFKAG